MNPNADSRPTCDATANENVAADTSAQKRKPGAVYCPRCPNWWTGLRSGHCATCHRSFTSVAAFDRHRSGSHARGTRHCVDPEVVGLVPAEREWPGWSLPGKWAGPEAEA